jgi:hypothetical protein
MRKIYAFAVATVVAAQLVGCIGVPPQPKGLTASTSQVTIDIKEPISYLVVKGINRQHWRYTLLPGTYMAEKENASGTFYRGPDRPILAERLDVDTGKVRKNGGLSRIGGVWIPKGTTEGPRIYVLIEAGVYISSPSGAPTRAPVARSVPEVGVPVGTPVIPGAVGGALAMAVVRALADNKADVGKIIIWDTPMDPQFTAAILSSIHPGPQ